MAGSFTCDWCGQSIDDFSLLNKMLCYGLPSNREWHLHRPADGYECMERAIAAFDAACGDQLARPTKPQDSFESSLDAWKQTHREEKLHRVLNAVGDERLSALQLLRRLQKDHCVYENELRRLLAKLLECGDIDRQKELRVTGGTAERWMYFRPSKPLSPELEALERALSNEEEVA